MLFGAVAGLAFAIVWRWLVPHVTHSRFWALIGTVSRDLLKVDEPAQLWLQYKILGRNLGVYLARNLGGIVLGLLPLVLILLFLAEPLFDASASRAERLVAVPDDAGIVITQPTSAASGEISAPDLASAIDVPDLTRRIGFCIGSFQCTTLETLGFDDAIPVEPEASRTVIVRADRGRWSPLWPWLSGLEFLFYTTFFVIMTVGLVVPFSRHRRSVGEDLAQK